MFNLNRVNNLHSECGLFLKTMVLISLSQIVRTSPSWSRMWFFLLWLVVIVLDVNNVSCSSDLFSGFCLTAENLGQERLWTRSVSSSTLQQLQSLGRRRRRNLAKCRWVWWACWESWWAGRSGSSRLPCVSALVFLCRGLWRIRSSVPIPCWRPLATPIPWGMTTPLALWVSGSQKGFLRP